METSDYPESGSNQLRELRSNLLQIYVALLRERGAFGSDESCLHYADKAGAEADAAAAALAAGDLEGCQKHLDAGFGWVAVGEACIALAKTL